MIKQNLRFGRGIISGILAAVIAAGSALTPAGASEDDALVQKLTGSWTDTRQFRDEPRSAMLFKGKQVTLKNFIAKDVTTDYRISDITKDGFTVSFEFTHKVKRGNGRIIDRREIFEFLWHEDQGHPVLSARGFEYDGRGAIILEEFMRDEELIDGYESLLKKELNNRKPIPTYMEYPPEPAAQE